MSLYTIHQATRDADLEARTTSAAHKEAIANAQFGNTVFGRQLLAGASLAWPTFAYPVAVDYEAEYASALAADNPAPGADEAVITDANIAAAVQAHWPPDPT